MPKTQEVEVSPPSQSDLTNLLKDFSAVIQRNLTTLFETHHDHLIVATTPAEDVGVVGDIWLYDDGSVQRLYVKYSSGWKKFNTD
jgi:hypothetical protein